MLFEKVMLELQCILSYAMPLTILRGNQMLELFISGLFFWVGNGFREEKCRENMNANK